MVTKIYYSLPNTGEVLKHPFGAHEAHKRDGTSLLRKIRSMKRSCASGNISDPRRICRTPHPARPGDCWLRGRPGS